MDSGGFLPGAEALEGGRSGPLSLSVGQVRFSAKERAARGVYGRAHGTHVQFASFSTVKSRGGVY